MQSRNNDIVLLTIKIVDLAYVFVDCYSCTIRIQMYADLYLIFYVCIAVVS